MVDCNQIKVNKNDLNRKVIKGQLITAKIQ